jgi:hypothetical protein
MSKKEANIWHIQSEIRDIINISRNRKKIYENRSNFLQIISCLDTIQDTEYGIHSYLDSYPEKLKKNKGFLYLTTYGILQLIFVQQDAIKNLSEAFGVEFELPVELKIIRDIRNRSTGHPTKKTEHRKKEIYSFNQILNYSLNYSGFKFWTFYSDVKEREETEFNCIDKIEENRKFCSQLLNNILTKLKNDENNHRKKYMNEKLVIIFDQMSYLFEKVKEGITDTKPIEFSRGIFKDLVKKIDTFDEKLKERNEDGCIDSYKEDLIYPIDKVTKYLNLDQTVDKEAAEIFIWYIQEKFKTLKQIAQDIDEEYETEE